MFFYAMSLRGVKRRGNLYAIRYAHLQDCHALVRNDIFLKNKKAARIVAKSCRFSMNAKLNYAIALLYNSETWFQLITFHIAAR
jgi:hypothetical protein